MKIAPDTGATTDSDSAVVSFSIHHSKDLGMPIRLFQAAFGFVFEKFIERS